MLKAIINSVKKSWRGDEKLWKVFWLWFIALYPASYLVGYGFLRITPIISDYSNFLAFIVSVIMALSGFTMIIIYPIIFIVSLWKCSKNYNGSSTLIISLIKLIPLLFLPFHFAYSWLVGIGTLVYLGFGLVLIKNFIGQ